MRLEITAARKQQTVSSLPLGPTLESSTAQQWIEISAKLYSKAEKRMKTEKSWETKRKIRTVIS